MSLDKALSDAVKAKTEKQKPADAQKPPIEGARLAKDGHWYVPDPRPSRKGKYMRVEV